MFERLKSILKSIAPETDLSTVGLETDLTAELGMNSITLIRLLLDIEDAYGFEFNGDEKFQNVGEVCEYIRKHATRNLNEA